MSVGRLAPVSFGPLQLSSDVFVLAAIFIERLLHLHVPAAEDGSLFLLGKRKVRIVFDVANDVWTSRVNVGHLNIVDVRILCDHHLSSSFRFRFRLLLLLLLLYLHELLERALQRNLPPLPLLWHWLGALLQQVDCPSLLFCTQAEIKVVLS